MKSSPIAILGFVFLLVSLVASKVSTALGAILILLSVIILLTLVLFRKRISKDKAINSILILFTVIIALLNFVIRDNITRNKIDTNATKEASISGYVKSENENMYDKNYCVIESSIYGTVRISSKQEFKAKLYDVIKVNVVFTTYDNRQNDIDLGAYAIGKYKVINQKPKDVTYYLLTLKKLARKYIDSTTKENSSIVRGIVLGDKNAISKEINRDFQLSGLTHILVFSGIHFTTAITFFTTLLRLFSSKRFILNLLTVIVDISIMIMVGFVPSVLRAGFASIALVIVSSLDYSSDSVSVLGMSVIFTGLFNPVALVNAGFILSFFACLGIALFSKRLHFYIITRYRLYNNIVSKIIKAVAVTFSAQIAVIPILCVYFDSISLVGLVSFLFVSVVCDCIVVLTLTAMLCASTGFLKCVGDFLMSVVSVFTDYVKMIASYFAKTPLSDVKNPYYLSLSVALCLLVILIAVIIYKYKTNLFKSAAILCAVIFITVNWLGINANNDLLRVCQTSSGDVVISSDNSVVVIAKSQSSYSLSQIQNQINNLSSGKIDVLIPLNDKSAKTVINNLNPKTVMTAFLTQRQKGTNYFEYPSCSIGDITVKLGNNGVLVSYGRAKIAIVNDDKNANAFRGSHLFVGQKLDNLQNANVVITNASDYKVKQLALLNNKVYNNDQYIMCAYIDKTATISVRRD